LTDPRLDATRFWNLATCCVLSLALFLCPRATAEDWPCHLHDNARSATTQEKLRLPLHEHWVFVNREAPRPAWAPPNMVGIESMGLPEYPRMRYDDAYYVSASGGLIFFGNSSDDKVYALDAETGSIRWSFFTGGPVRLAPAVSEGRVFFGSDDGFAYCLDASTGKLIWKVRGAPSGRKLLGNGRMVSVWPVRTGVLVADGVAYFAAGLFPAERVYLRAVNASDGTVIWRNDTVGDRNAGQSNFCPQGYLLASSDKLFVPSSRAMPAVFSRKDGRLLYQSGFGWRSTTYPPGGTFALLADDHLLTGTKLLHSVDQKTGRIGFASFRDAA